MKPEPFPTQHNHRWAVILAGGDGMRLRPLTRVIAGDDRPKQFCSILGSKTLLEQTRQRVGRMIDPKRTLLVVTRTHEQFYADQIDGTPASCLLEQPYNRGTAPAIIYSLMRLRELDRRAVVGLFPSDHHFADDDAFIAHVSSAFEAAEGWCSCPVLLGVQPGGPEAEYGWIEPGTLLASHGSIFGVSRFWEKPSPTFAATLMARGCLWNSFIMVGRIDTFLNLIRLALPDLIRSFESIRARFLTGAEREAMFDLYWDIQASNFSEEVLSARPQDLVVLSAGDLGWSDLGEPARVRSLLERKGVRSASVSGQPAIGQGGLMRSANGGWVSCE